VAVAKGAVLARFADVLVPDLAAIRADLSRSPSTGLVDEQISYRRMIRRIMPDRSSEMAQWKRPIISDDILDQLLAGGDHRDILTDLVRLDIIQLPEPPLSA
jgi:hypothetical protein